MQKSDDKNPKNDRGEQSLPEPDSAHERNKAAPDSDDLLQPEKVWEDAETTPSDQPPKKSGGDRVADAGDLGQGTASPYSEETQADSVARQTKRTRSGR